MELCELIGKYLQENNKNNYYVFSTGYVPKSLLSALPTITYQILFATLYF